MSIATKSHGWFFDGLMRLNKVLRALGVSQDQADNSLELRVLSTMGMLWHMATQVTARSSNPLAIAIAWAGFLNGAWQALLSWIRRERQ